MQGQDNSSGDDGASQGTTAGFIQASNLGDAIQLAGFKFKLESGSDHKGPAAHSNES